MSRADWFSSLPWWQKALIAAAFFVALMTVLLLPGRVGVLIVIALMFSTTTLSFLALQLRYRIALILLLAAGVTALVVSTENTLPYLVVLPAVLALVLSVVRGWFAATSRPPRQK
jgi:hypothetical protein